MLCCSQVCLVSQPPKYTLAGRRTRILKAKPVCSEYLRKPSRTPLRVPVFLKTGVGHGVQMRDALGYLLRNRSGPTFPSALAVIAHRTPLGKLELRNTLVVIIKTRHYARRGSKREGWLDLENEWRPTGHMASALHGRRPFRERMGAGWTCCTITFVPQVGNSPTTFIRISLNVVQM